jgi:hypothetical protein
MSSNCKGHFLDTDKEANLPLKSSYGCALNRVLTL